jgi:hypothetical protein
MIIQRINRSSFAKFSGIFCILIGAIVSIPAGLYFMIKQSLMGGIMIIVFGPAIAGLDGVITGFIFALCFNAVSRFAGGIKLEVQQQ